jgi:hypothetical protein
MDDKLYAELKKLAAEENRSLSQQALFLFKDYMARKRQVKNFKTPAEVLLELSASWEDERDSETIIAKIKKARKNSKEPQKRF